MDSSKISLRNLKYQESSSLFSEIQPVTTHTSKKSARTAGFTKLKLTNWEFVKVTMAACFGVDNFTLFLEWMRSDLDTNFLHHLIVYTIVALPLVYLQTAIGQYTQLGITSVHYLCPISRGLIFMMLWTLVAPVLLSSIWLGNYLLYMLLSFMSTLQWMYCPPGSDEQCWGLNNMHNCTNSCLTVTKLPSAFYYYKYTFLGLNDQEFHRDYFKVGVPNDDSSTLVVIAWIIIFFILYFGMFKYKRLIEINLVIACIFLILLFLVITFVGGSFNGVSEFFKINLNSLFSLKHWTYTVSNCVRAFGFGQGVFMMNGVGLYSMSSVGYAAVGSTLFMFMMTMFVSLLSSEIFFILVNQANVTDMSGLEIHIKSNLYPPDVTIIPQGLGYIAAAQLWSIIYFSMLIFLTINNTAMQILLFERCITDNFQSFMKYRRYLIGVLCIVLCIMSSVITSEQSYMLRRYFFNLVCPLLELLNTFLLTFFVCYVYTVFKFCDDIHFAVGTQPIKFWKLCWLFLPIILIITFIFEVEFLYKECPKCKMRYVRIFVFVVYFIPAILITIYEIVTYIRKGNLINVIMPQERWGPADPEERRLRRIFNPRKETKSRRRSEVCQHNCLLGNKVLKKLVQDEIAARRDVDNMRRRVVI